MALTDGDRHAAAEALLKAEAAREWAEPTSTAYPDADVADAYAIATLVAEAKVAAGRTVKGHKVGLTSVAMRSLTGATEPDYGTLFDDHFVPEGTSVPMTRLNRPSVEVEIAFVLGGDLPGPAVNAVDVILATEFVLPAIEVIDSRFTGDGENLLVDSISDAASCGVVVLGANPALLADIDVRRCGASLARNGEIEESGVASAVMGNPINSVAWLANKLLELGLNLEAGQIVLSGSFIRAIRFGAGDTLSATFDQLGDVTFGVTAE